MYNALTPQGVRIQNGFAITAEGYRHVLDEAGAWPALHRALDRLDPANVDDLARRALARRAATSIWPEGKSGRPD